ncbi:MAG: hypothetical protein ACJ76Y_15945 [Thermoanaerobaculia bacterium]
MERGEARRAAALLERAVVLLPEDPNLFYLCARAESLAGDRDRAIQTEQLSDDGRLLVPLAKLQPVVVRALRLLEPPRPTPAG